MTPEILLTLPYNPGDAAMALPAAAQIRRLVPHAALDFLTGEEFREPAEASGLFRRVHAIPRRLLREKGGADPGEALRALASWLEEWQSRHYSLSLNLFQERFGGILHAFIRADRKAGLELKDGCRFEVGSRPLEHLFAVPAARAQNPFHASDLYRLSACAALGLPHPADSAPAPWLRMPKESPFPFPPGSYLVFHAGAAFPGKRWPARHWTRLASLCREQGHRIVWTGTAEEREWVRSILDPLGPDTEAAMADLTGHTTLAEAAAVFAGARRVVCGDTAAMHLAAAAGTPVLALFGPTNPVETGPYGPGHLVLQQKPVQSPDFELDRENHGLASLTPETVAGLVAGNASALSAPGIWGTAWHTAGVQVMRDAHGKLHPFQGQVELWLALLAGNARAGVGSRDSALPLRQALEAAMAKPDSASVALLEKREKAFSEMTSGDLVWEAYRIALNGLPLQPLAEHLARRLQLLARAEKEAGLGIVSGLAMV